MDTAEIKLSLIQQITNLKEIALLEGLKDFLDFEMDASPYKLNELQKMRLEEAMTDEVISETQANKEIEEWLSEK